jgi:uncharacterized membrane protein YfcA
MSIFFLVLGVAVGVASGMIGIGGGVLVVPCLVYFAHMTQHKAQGTSLAFLLAPIGIFAFWQYYKAGNVDVRAAILLAAGFAVGGWLGGRWAQSIPDLMLKRVFSIALMLVGAQMLLRTFKW